MRQGKRKIDGITLKISKSCGNQGNGSPAITEHSYLQTQTSVPVISTQHDLVPRPRNSSHAYSPSSVQYTSVSKAQPDMEVDRVELKSCDQNIESHLGNICTFDGTHVLSEHSKAWIKSITGEDISLLPFPQTRHTENPLSWNAIGSQDSCLPDKTFVYRQLASYQRSIFGQFFPILDLPLFWETVSTAYQGSGPRSGKRYYKNALCLVPAVLKGPPSWTTDSSSAVTASRNLLGSFLNSGFNLGSQNLLFCLSYFMQASFNLFCKVLSQTSDASDFEDVILIIKISIVIEEHLNRDTPDHFDGKIAFVPQFIPELSRLGERILLKSFGCEK
ncbi:uncharacterized protein KD926_008864 [Aspergillus affinis]|uniref:uncharacterized protein n=1 Tax=Aspergillus affinis TaxID=1070780 RepID=UPI0022FE7C06|nr:uncharacterized protein KD926_008864 [Aspergillus affinis]KAI9045437.1 hypothetical protein KD926_008864 [Aspergillus affinis]